jgi:hypothetical protein
VIFDGQTYTESRMFIVVIIIISSSSSPPHPRPPHLYPSRDSVWIFPNIFLLLVGNREFGIGFWNGILEAYFLFSSYICNIL